MRQNGFMSSHYGQVRTYFQMILESQPWISDVLYLMLDEKRAGLVKTILTKP